MLSHNVFVGPGMHLPMPEVAPVTITVLFLISISWSITRLGNSCSRSLLLMERQIKTAVVTLSVLRFNQPLNVA